MSDKGDKLSGLNAPNIVASLAAVIVVISILIPFGMSGIDAFKAVIPLVIVTFVVWSLFTTEVVKGVGGAIGKVLKGIIVFVGIVASFWLTPFGQYAWTYDLGIVICIALTAVAYFTLFGKGKWLKRFMVFSLTIAIVALIVNTIMLHLHRDTQRVIFTYENNNNGYPTVSSNPYGSISVPAGRELRVQLKGYYKFTAEDGAENKFPATGDAKELVDLAVVTSGKLQGYVPRGQQILVLVDGNNEKFFSSTNRQFAAKVSGNAVNFVIPGNQNPGGIVYLRPAETAAVLPKLKGKIHVKVVSLMEDETTLMVIAEQTFGFKVRHTQQAMGDKEVVEEIAERAHQYKRARLVKERDELLTQSSNLSAVREAVREKMQATAGDVTVTDAEVEAEMDVKLAGMMEEINRINRELKTLEAERENAGYIPPVPTRFQQEQSSAPVPQSTHGAVSTQTPSTSRMREITVTELVKQFPPAGNFPASGQATLRVRNEGCDPREPHVVVFKAIEGNWRELCRVAVGMEATVTKTNGLANGMLTNEDYIVVLEKDGNVIPPIPSTYSGQGAKYLAVDTATIRKSMKQTLAAQGSNDDIVIEIVCPS